MTTATLNPPKKTASLAPMQGEQQSAFFDRASRALRKSIPSVNRRTVEVLRMWRQSANAADMNERATNQFPDSEYVHFGPRCIFLEHTIPGGEQQEKIVYDRDSLQKLVNWANYRIADSATYAAISDGHTPDETERAAGKDAPDVLGYAGPFYLGLLGDMDPKWAIYADEWVHKADLERFKRLQRRSPEVWCSEPMESRTMDPIAALGAETPRLDSGMNPYSRVTDGKTVMRYSASFKESDHHRNDDGKFSGGGSSEVPEYESPQLKKNKEIIAKLNNPSAKKLTPKQEKEKADKALHSKLSGMTKEAKHALAKEYGIDVAKYPSDWNLHREMISNADLRGKLSTDKYSAAGGPMVMAGPNNSYIPGSKPKTVVDYSGESQMDMPVVAEKPDMGTVFANALQGLLPSLVQAVNQALSTDPADNTDEPDAPLGEDFSDVEESVDNVIPDDDLIDGAETVEEEIPVDDPEDLKYKAMGADCYAAYQAGKMSKAKYSKREAPVDKEIHAKIAQLTADRIEDRRKIAALEKTNADTVRYHKRSEKLNQLAADHEFDPAEEQELTADFSDDQFERHCSKVIAKYAKRDELSLNLFDDPEPMRYSRTPAKIAPAQLEKYSREAQNTAAQKNGAARKNVTTYEAELEAIFKRHGVAI